MTAGLGSSCETRFMYINSLELGTMTSNSGAMTGFPASNAVSMNRGNLWVTNGLFKIDATNNKMYLEVNYTLYTATLASGNYSGTTLAAEIQTKVRAATSTLLTCTYLSTYKFHFELVGADFAMVLSNQTTSTWYDVGLLGVVNITVDSGDELEGEIRIHTHEFMYFDLGYAMDISFFALMPQRNYSNMLTAGATLNIRASNVNDITTAPLSVNVPAGAEGSFYFLETGIPVAYRYVWFTLLDPANPFGPNLVFSQIFLGGYIALPNRTVDSGFTLQDVDRALRTESQAGGLYFERYGRHQRISGLKFSNLTRVETTAIQQLYYDIGKSNNFYLSLDSGNFNDDLTEFTNIGVFDNDPTITSKPSNYFDANFEFRSN
jgi:hypothetical protein